MSKKWTEISAYTTPDRTARLEKGMTVPVSLTPQVTPIEGGILAMYTSGVALVEVEKKDFPEGQTLEGMPEDRCAVLIPFVKILNLMATIAMRKRLIAEGALKPVVEEEQQDGPENEVSPVEEPVSAGD